VGAVATDPAIVVNLVNKVVGVRSKPLAIGAVIVPLPDRAGAHDVGHFVNGRVGADRTAKCDGAFIPALAVVHSSYTES